MTWKLIKLNKRGYEIKHCLQEDWQSGNPNTRHLILSIRYSAVYSIPSLYSKGEHKRLEFNDLKCPLKCPNCEQLVPDHILTQVKLLLN